MFCVHQIDEETQQIDEDIHHIDDEMDQIDVVYGTTVSDETGLTGDETIENSTGEMVCDLISFYGQK